jgi:hypothetical protein
LSRLRELDVFGRALLEEREIDALLHVHVAIVIGRKPIVDELERKCRVAEFLEMRGRIAT